MAHVPKQNKVLLQQVNSHCENVLWYLNVEELEAFSSKLEQSFPCRIKLRGCSFTQGIRHPPPPPTQTTCFWSVWSVAIYLKKKRPDLNLWTHVIQFSGIIDFSGSCLWAQVDLLWNLDDVCQKHNQEVL